MSYPTPNPKPATIGRVVHDARRRHVGRGPGVAGKREFKRGRRGALADADHQ